MTAFIQFETQDGSPLFLEVDEASAQAPRGVEKAGDVAESTETVVAKAAKTFEQAMGETVRTSMSAVVDAMADLPTPPAEIEFAFGVKASAEFGGLVIAKAAGEASFTVRLLWKP